MKYLPMSIFVIIVIVCGARLGMAYPAYQSRPCEITVPTIEELEIEVCELRARVHNLEGRIARIQDYLFLPREEYEKGCEKDYDYWNGVIWRED